MSTYEQSGLSACNQLVIGMSANEQSGMLAYEQSSMQTYEQSGMSTNEPPGIYVGI